MVSLLIKNQDFAVFLTKTHHLKTLYIMAEGMTVKTAPLPDEGRILPYELIINGLGSNMPAGLLTREEPVILSGRCVLMPDPSR